MRAPGTGDAAAPGRLVHRLAGLEGAAGSASIRRMNDASKPDDLPAPSDAQVQALIALRDELQALNARLEYVALMLRLARAPLTK